MSSFVLDQRLEAHTLPVGDLALSRVLLMDDARFPWLLLVPRRAAAVELLDLSPADRQQLMIEIAAVSAALRELHAPDKLNVGALGNHVRQLHVHVLARFASDAAWPGPVWGNGTRVPYPPHAAALAVDRLASALAGDGLTEAVR